MATLSPQPQTVDTVLLRSRPVVFQDENGVRKSVDANHPLPVTAAVTSESTAKATAAAPTYSEGADAPLSQDLKGRLRVVQVGATSLSIVRATSTGTAATLIVARPTRSGALVRNLDTANSVWVGPATVTTANGFLVKAGETLPITWVGLVQIIDDNTNHAAVAVIDEYY